MRDHGGEATFWLAWLADELSAELCAWFRAEARRDPALGKDLESVDQPAARAQLRNALEATNYLAVRDPGAAASGEELTGLALKEDQLSDAAPPSTARRRLARREGRQELHQRVSRSLFQLLEEVEIPLPAGDEAREATALLHHLVGLPAVDRFRQLDRWLGEARRRGDKPLPALDRALRWLTPELFEQDGSDFRARLSFRLFLRCRLKDYCQQRGWRPAGPLYRDLETAFAQLRRERIGQLVYRTIEESSDAGLEEACVSPRQVLQWLQAAP
jgi:hypothetical protein